jgi:hypothetical protein
MIVEDTHVSGHPVEWEWGKGPFEAVEDFLKTNDNFEASLSGNGDIVNYGTGKAIILKQSGNGQVIYRN